MQNMLVVATWRGQCKHAGVVLLGWAASWGGVLLGWRGFRVSGLGDAERFLDVNGVVVIHVPQQRA
jgi:hypothetical protein